MLDFIRDRIEFWKPKETEDTSRFIAPSPEEMAQKAFMDVAISEQRARADSSRRLIVDSPSQTSKDKEDSENLAIVASSVTRFFGETFNPYSFSTFRDLYKFSEPSLYSTYQESYKQNPFTTMVVEYIINECFANDYHFEGPGAKVVEKFFLVDGTRGKLEITWRETIKKGNGFMDFGKKRGMAMRTRVLSTDDIQIEFDEKTGERIYKQGILTLKPELIVHMMLREEVGNPYGISLLRSNILFLTALMDVGGDSMAALKRIAYAPMVAGLDLSNMTENEKKRYLAEWKERLKNMESAGQNFAIDKRHELTLLGQGGSGAKLLPINDLIEPIVSVVLMNFGIPIGIYLQTGANKAIIDEQRKAMDRFYEELRGRFKNYVETKIVPQITGRETRLVFNRAPLSTEQTRNELITLIQGYQSGLLSREYILDYMDIEDSGKTLVLPNANPTDRGNDGGTKRVPDKNGGNEGEESI